MAARDDKSTRDAGAAQAPETLRQRFLDYVMDDKRLPSIGRELVYAVTDIRQKLVEEAAYGRTVTPDRLDGGVHGRAEPGGKGDPLGRSAPDDPFRERCRQTYESRQQDGPERGDHGPDR